MHIRLKFHLHENSQRSNICTTGCEEQISVYISRSKLHQKFQKKRKKLKKILSRKTERDLCSII